MKEKGTRSPRRAQSAECGVSCPPARHFACPIPRVAGYQFSMILRPALSALALALVHCVHPVPSILAADDAASLLATAGVKGGIVVQLGVGDGALATALRASESYQVQALDTDAAKVAAAREAIFAKGKYGPVSVERFDGKLLPYIDNFVNLLVAEDLGTVPMEEVKRVLVPYGVALVKQGGEWKKTTKSWSDQLDEWTHYYYSAKGNAVSKDKQVGPPSRLQWVGSPRWSRHHDRMSSVSAQVTSKGRLYYIMDEGSRISILLPSKWNLIARDAFNGTVLWKKPIEKWSEHMWPLKSGPTQLTRRLVADGDRIFCTLGIGEPISVVDGGTGQVVRTFPDTKGAEEILHVDGVIYSLVNPKEWATADFAPKLQQDQQRVAQEYEWDKKPRSLVAVEADSGAVLWKKEQTKIAPITLSADGKRVVFYDGDALVCLDAKTGAQKWASGPAPKRKLLEYNFGPRIVLTGETVLYAGGDGSQKGLDAESGKELWTAPHEKSGYRSPEDLLVASGLVWNAGTTSGNQSGEFIGRDPRTGEAKKQFLPDVPDGTYWFHHRCYIAKGTESFLMPSRTGIEYVDLDQQSWDLNHWVRGACLYGVLPANGLTYAGPHNCACYPEAKLDGLNAMSVETSPWPATPSDEQRLERGPAYQSDLSEQSDPTDWPTYRQNNARSGSSPAPLAKDLGKSWEVQLTGPLSALTIAAGQAYVAQVDAHTLHALDASTGQRRWHFIAGARIDSPPTIARGRVYFGSKDGHVYCLRASDGALVWRFQAAPNLRRHAALEQIESVWPVHGSVLVENGTVNCVAGRSVFLDGGLRFLRLDAATGRKLAEVVYDDKDPETGGDFQDRHKTLQMPVGLNDILSSDGKVMYLRSQKILADGSRIEIGPISANVAEQAGTQKGEGRHLFAPMGFLDDSWFHRSYWIYGKNFAGGHNGYFQAGKFTPEGRILVHDEKNVYGYSRLPQYYKWTTTMEHQLFSASVEAPDVDLKAVAAAQGGPKKKQAAEAGAKAAVRAEGANVKFDGEKITAGGKPLTIEAWVLPDGPDGVIAQHGGSNTGYALALQEGRPAFSIRAEKVTTTAQAQRALDQGWHHLAGVLTDDQRVILYVDGQLAAEAKANAFPGQPRLGLSLGDAGSSLVSDFGKGAPYTGLLDNFAVFSRALSTAEIVEHANGANFIQRGLPGALVACTFDNGDARDDAGGKLLGAVSGAETGKGKMGAALWFKKPGGAPSVLAQKPGAAPAAAGPKQGSFVEHQWNAKSTVFARAMAMAKDTVFVSGPPDMIDEEYAFERMAQKDPEIFKELAEQDAALDGKKGASILAVNTKNGDVSGDVKLESPPVWDGIAIARGRLYVASVDGKVTCYGK
jgi:outer membrane protein assembly factor BamB